MSQKKKKKRTSTAHHGFLLPHAVFPQSKAQAAEADYIGFNKRKAAPKAEVVAGSNMEAFWNNCPQTLGQ
jgi:hypothetical protein